MKKNTLYVKEGTVAAQTPTIMGTREDSGSFPGKYFKKYSSELNWVNHLERKHCAHISVLWNMPVLNLHLSCTFITLHILLWVLSILLYPCALCPAVYHALRLSWRPPPAFLWPLFASNPPPPSGPNCLSIDPTELHNQRFVVQRSSKDAETQNHIRFIYDAIFLYWCQPN